MNALPGAAIPGVVDGKVLTESIGTALAAGRFARVPLINGIVHDENRIFVGLGAPVVNGPNVPLPEPVTAESYQRLIASVLGVPADRAAAIAADTRSARTRPRPRVQRGGLGRGVRARGAEAEPLGARYAPGYAYEFRRQGAAALCAARIPAADCDAQPEMQYLFALPHTPVPAER